MNQAAVLRRKAEEAAAANNRLKDLMQKQKVVSDNKNKKQQQADASNIGTRIRVGLRGLLLIYSALLARGIPSVCLSVRPSRSGIVSRRMKIC